MPRLSFVSSIYSLLDGSTATQMPSSMPFPNEFTWVLRRSNISRALVAHRRSIRRLVKLALNFRKGCKQHRAVVNRGLLGANRSTSIIFLLINSIKHTYSVIKYYLTEGNFSSKNNVHNICVRVSSY